MTENPNVESQDITNSTDKLPSSSFFHHWSKHTSFAVAGFVVLIVLGIGYLLFQSSQPDQTTQESVEVSITPTQPTTVQNTTIPTIDTNTPPTTQPLATKKPVTPTPAVIAGVDMRFVDVHFYRDPDPMVAYTPFRVANGGSITVPNEKNVSEFELFAIFVNHGTDESKNVWVHYSVDGVEVKKGLAYLPGNMVTDNLVTRDSAQPVMIPASGTHTVKIVIDPENQSNDVNQTNNTYTFTYTVK
jgi:hypothetical protein